MNISMDRQDLLDRLNERLALAKREDDRLAGAHKRDEENALKEFRLALRRAMKWPYETAKSKSRYSSGLEMSRPTCPTLNAPTIQRVINGLKLDRRDHYVFDEKSDIGQAALWLPESERPKVTTCD